MRFNPDSSFIVYFNIYIKQIIFLTSIVTLWRWYYSVITRETLLCTKRSCLYRISASKAYAVQPDKKYFHMWNNLMSTQRAPVYSVRMGSWEGWSFFMWQWQEEKKKSFTKCLLYVRKVLDIFNWFIIFSFYSTLHRKALWPSSLYVQHYKTGAGNSKVSCPTSCTTGRAQKCTQPFWLLFMV